MKWPSYHQIWYLIGLYTILLKHQVRQIHLALASSVPTLHDLLDLWNVAIIDIMTALYGIV